MKKILIIDDEKNIRFLISSILQDEGYSTIEASSVPESELIIENKNTTISQKIQLMNKSNSLRNIDGRLARIILKSVEKCKFKDDEYIRLLMYFIEKGAGIPHNIFKIWF